MANQEHYRMLARGSEEWNSWREVIGDTPDFEGADLRKLDLRDCNLSCAQLSQANLENCDLEGSTLHRVDANSAKFSGAMLSGVDFSSADLEHAKFTGARLINTTFDGSSLYGTDFSNADMRGAKGVLLDGSIIRGTHFSPHSDDLWSTLRRNYTGSKMVFHLLMLLMFVLPLVTKAAFWLGVNRFQEAVADQVKQIEKNIDSFRIDGESAEVLRKISNEIANLISCSDSSCEPEAVWTVVTGLNQDIHLAVLAFVFIVYNVARAILTFVVSGLRDEEIRSGYSPDYSHRICSGQVVVDTFNSDNSNFIGDRSSLAECNRSML